MSESEAAAAAASRHHWHDPLAPLRDDPLAGLTFAAEDVLLLVAILGVTLIINNFLQKRNIPVPEAICTIVLGCCFGAGAYAVPEVTRSTFVKLEDSTAKQFMLVFIAPIIFAEGYGLKSRQFFANISRILVHAFIGTLVSTIVVAFLVFYLARWTQQATGLGPVLDLTFAECLCFGALISSTDPVTTLAIFKDQQMVENGLGSLYYSVLGESILNDAVAVTLFGSFGKLVEDGQENLGTSEALAIVQSFMMTFLCSMAIGACCGAITALVLKFARLGAGGNDEEHFYFNVPEVGVALVMAYVPFLIAEALDFSGIVAIMFSGITMRHYAHYNLTQVTRMVFLPIIELFATLCETYVFLLLGLGVFLLVKPRIFSVPLILWTLVSCFIGRAANVYPLSWAVNQCSSGPKFRLSEQHVLWFAGLRGAMAFVCALGFPEGPVHQNRDLFLCVTMITVGITVVFLGWPTASFLRYLDIKAPDDDQLQLREENDGGLRPPESSACNVSRHFKRLGGLLDRTMLHMLLTQDALLERKDAGVAVTTQRGSTLISHPRISSFFASPDGIEIASARQSLPSARPSARPSAVGFAVGQPSIAEQPLAARPSAPARLQPFLQTSPRPSLGFGARSGARPSLGGGAALTGRASMPPLRSHRTICDI